MVIAITNIASNEKKKSAKVSVWRAGKGCVPRDFNMFRIFSEARMALTDVSVMPPRKVS